MITVAPMMALMVVPMMELLMKPAMTLVTATTTETREAPGAPRPITTTVSSLATTSILPKMTIMALLPAATSILSRVTMHPTIPELQPVTVALAPTEPALALVKRVLELATLALAQVLAAKRALVPLKVATRPRVATRPEAALLREMLPTRAELCRSCRTLAALRCSRWALALCWWLAGLWRAESFAN